MDVLIEFLDSCRRYILTVGMTIGISDLLDMAIVAYLVYRLLALVKSTSSEKLMKGVLFIILALALSSEFQLNSLKYLLNMMVEWGVLALIILFQPEIRRIL